MNRSAATRQRAARRQPAGASCTGGLTPRRSTLPNLPDTTAKRFLSRRASPMLPTLHAAADQLRAGRAYPSRPPRRLPRPYRPPGGARPRLGVRGPRGGAGGGGAAHRGNPPRRLARPAARHPPRDQGHLRRVRLADGGRVAVVEKQRGAAGRDGGAQTAPGGGGVHRQDGDDAVRQLRSAADAQPVEPAADAGRLAAAARRRRVACGMCLGALGSQTGGSITRPAVLLRRRRPASRPTAA